MERVPVRVAFSVGVTGERSIIVEHVPYCIFTVEFWSKEKIIPPNSSEVSSKNIYVAI